jgi:hypothetical protein
MDSGVAIVLKEELSNNSVPDAKKRHYNSPLRKF